MGNQVISEVEAVTTAAMRWSKTWPQHLAAALAALALVCAGATTCFTSPAMPYLELPYSKEDNVTVPVIAYEQRFYIFYLYPLGALIGALPAEYLADQHGRRFLMLITAVPMLLSWLMILWGGRSIAMLYIARFVLGFTCGVVSVVSPLYIDEIAEVRARGGVGSYLNLMFIAGMLYVYIFSAILSYAGMTIACIMLPVLFAVTFYWMPESPLYLLTKGQDEKAKKSLCWLRGVGTGQSAEIEGELSEMESFINRPILKAINVFGLMAISLLCVLIAEPVEYFETAGSAWDPYEIKAAIFGVVQIAFMLIVIFIADYVAKRILLIVSGVVVSFFLLMFIVIIHKLERVKGEYFPWFPELAGKLFMAVLGIWLGPAPWSKMSELLSNGPISWVNTLAVCFNWTTTFLVTRYFLVMTNEWSSEATYVTFLFICLVGTISVARFHQN
jgi:SP family facilitated glucose transporter-like MFS transporter 8